jgi:anti-sigma regulatory factor (Ser/Thr protein kinase)
MNNRERGERIRRQILRDVEHHPGDIAKHIANIFSITPQAVNNHVRRLEKEGWLASSGIGKGKRYSLGDLREYNSLFPLSNDLAEDRVWRNHYSFIFEDLPENIVDICHYGFTEMVNNVIDHSGGTEVYISVLRKKDNIVIFIMDDGEGIFKRIKRLCELFDEGQALLELSKGKLTTDPDNHTGEGIFFTSRVFDEFEIDSKGLNFSHDDKYEFDFFDDSNMPRNKVGTVVYMLIQRNSHRLIKDIFDEYTAGPEEFQFNRTVIPVRLAQYENEKLVSRSQAKRLLTRIENFQNVIFDFEGVSTVGQAFADEIFRVYAQRHPEITLLAINAELGVSMMVNKAISALEEK